MSSKLKEGKLVNLNRMPIADQCEGCQRVVEEGEAKLCSRFADPEFHWENDQICAFATHIKREVKVVKKVLNPLKASKRAGKR